MLVLLLSLGTKNSLTVITLLCASSACELQGTGHRVGVPMDLTSP